MKKNNPAEYKKIIDVRKALSTLLNSSVINQRENDLLKSIKNRIIHDYGINLVDRKALYEKENH